MSTSSNSRKVVFSLSAILAVFLIGVIFLTYMYIDTKEKLLQTDADLQSMSILQENTSATLADMTALQVETASSLANSESILADTQTALADMTALQEETALSLANSESMLDDTQTALADMTALQEETALSLANSESILADTQTALADMTALQEDTAATLANCESTLAETQTALADMTALQEDTAASLDAALITISENEVALETANNEIITLKAALNQTNTSSNEYSDISADDIILDNSNTDGYIVTKEYTWTKYDTHRLALAVQNLSGSSKRISAQILFFSEDNTIVSVSNVEQYVCGNNEIAYLSCSCENDYSYYDYSIVLEEAYSTSLNSSIIISTTQNPNNVIIMCTNNGDITPDYIEYNCLFFDANNNIVSTDWGYIDEPAPGASSFEEIDSYDEFDRFEFYYTSYTFD